MLIAGTGYQYGDTDLLEYSERLYAEVTRQLRVGNGTVPVGEALLRAKQDYLATTPVLSGIHQKALLEASLYGLPMVGMDLPTGRIVDAAPATASPSPVTTGPGSRLGLTALDLTASGATSVIEQPFADLDGTGLGRFTYLRGTDGTTTSPGQPALPLQSLEVGVPGAALRGIGFRGGSYVDTPGVVPLTGAPTTDTSEVHTAFSSPVFFPRRLAVPNTFGALGGDGGTRLLVAAAQHRSENALTSTLRRYSSLDLRLLYSGNTQTYAGNRPALAASPAVSSVTSTVTGDVVKVEAMVVGDPSAGIQEVWLTRTAERGPWYGAWRSLDLTQDPADSRRWTGTLVLPAGQTAEDVRFVVQAANGVGLVTLEDNQGKEFTPGVDPAAVPEAGDLGNTLVLDAPSGAVLGASLPVSATLTSTDGPVAGRFVRFSFGSATRTAQTGSDGVARSAFPVVERPGDQVLSASFDGDPTLRPSVAQRSVVVTKRPTALLLTGPGGPVWTGDDPGVVATLSASGAPVADRSVLLVVRDSSGQVVSAVAPRTAPDGTAGLGTLDVPEGTYEITAYFGQEGVPVAGGSTTGSVDPENAAATSAPLLLELVEGLAPELTTTTLPDAQAGAAYEAAVEVSGDPEPEVTLTGLPDGLTYADGIISGTTLVAGSYELVVNATNRKGEISRPLTLVVRPGAPASVAPVSGSGQGAVFGTAFRDPLVVRVTDAWGNSVPDVAVVLTSPATGPGTDPRATEAVTGADGLASVPVTAGPDVGAYDVVASVVEASPAITAEPFRLTNRYALSSFGAPFAAEDGQTVELSASTAAPLTVKVSDRAGPVPHLAALNLAVGCRVTLTDFTGATQSAPVCMVYDALSGRFTVPVVGALASWRAGTLHRLQVDVRDTAGRVIGSRSVQVSVR